jgi:hypothetical protein
MEGKILGRELLERRLLGRRLWWARLVLVGRACEAHRVVEERLGSLGCVSVLEDVK